MAVSVPESLPVGESEVANLPRAERRSASRMAQYIWREYMAGLANRRSHALAWIMIRAFFRGIHYFKLDTWGNFQPIPPKAGQIRSATPLMRPAYRHVLGFLNGNPLGVTVTPLSGSAESIAEADRAKDILHGWIEDAGITAVRRELSRILLVEGMAGLHPYVDSLRENVFLRLFPASEIFPIPADATNEQELSGLMHATMVTKSWLELQDEEFERTTGRLPHKRMSDRVKTAQGGFNVNLPLVGSTTGDRFTGSLAITVWMKKTPRTPGGEYMFLLGEEMFRYVGGIGPNGQPKAAPILPDGEIPVSLLWWDKDPQDFWGCSLCESMIPSQFAVNRQMTAMERNALRNRSLVGYDVRSTTAAQIQDEESGLIPINQDHLEGTRRAPLYYFPAQQVGLDAHRIVEVTQRFADQASGFRSGIVYGQQEGRTESGPATSLLANNAMASTITPLEEADDAWTKTYKRVLDLVPTVWPDGKILQVSGPGNVGRELKIKRDMIPASQKVRLKARPMLPGGRNAMVSILFQLKQVPGSDGKPGTELGPGEFRAALAELNLLPPGIDAANKVESRIQTRINLLIGDGVNPRIKASHPGDLADRLFMENHKLSVDMLKAAILDEAWYSYSTQVRLGLLQQVKFHMSFLHGGSLQPNVFDDDLDALEMGQLARHLELAEADLETSEGEMDPLLEAIGA